ncbi:hypothetical protein SLEP1_g4472 [Rubroshorea leprosula]|uniref:Uncharacterized protein n=1 Tax=Rubroshorea leprosula TaxID=152421 RepID=A0AAV5HPA2_9ROSI|nr:hypothetical protein SLEP1_g4472 [Rubroshorea leprosula]
MIIKVRPQVKKAKTDQVSAEEPSVTARTPEVDAGKTTDPAENPNGDTKPYSMETPNVETNKHPK